MKSPMFSSQWLQVLLLALALAVSSVAATRFNVPRLSPYWIRHLDSTTNSSDLQIFYYNQTLDHFNYRHESYTKFRQKYVVNSKYWGGPNSPIFAYLGAEVPIGNDISYIGFFKDNAPKFKALQISMEHRFYGQSIPFGLSTEEVMKNESLRGYFNSAQALADYAEILLYIKEEFNAQHSPIIVVGGSYGGMLAAWFRLKYPHVALGALASSAPLLYFDNIKPTPAGGFYTVVTNDFKEASETCYQIIVDSWAEINRVASDPNGLSILSQKFKTCQPLSNPSDLVNYLVEDLYVDSAQNDKPPEYPVNAVCAGIDGSNSTDILSKIFAGVVSKYGPQSCYINKTPSDLKKIDNTPSDLPSETIDGWSWQRCSEMAMSIGISKDTMFPYEVGPFNLSSFEAECESKYGVRPRSHWITTYYGGHDIKLILQRFGSNIIFSNGLRDPFSSGGVLENLSESLLAVYTKHGSHCLDLLNSEDSDPEWLVEQRAKEVQIIRQWLNKYYVDLRKELTNK